MKKKLLSMLLVLVMLLGMLPMGAMAAETELSVSGGTITLPSGIALGPLTLTKVDMYEPVSPYNAVSITSATMDGTTINVTLAEGTNPSLAIQAGFGSNAGGGITISYASGSNKCTLSNGTGTMNINMAATRTGQVLGSATYTINFTVPMGEAYTVSKPDDTGFTFTGAETVYEGSPYTFQIAVNEGYDGTNMVVRVNGTEIEGSNGSYTVENVTEDLTIIVEGVVAKEVCTITPPIAEGVTFTGAASVYKGNSYSFTIAVDGAYDASNMVVKAGETELPGSNGAYTIAAVNENTVITVSGVEKKNTYTVTLTEGESYTISGQSTSYAGEDYTFTVTVDDAIYFADQITVKVNDVPVTLTNGKYTIAALDGDKTVTVENVVERTLFTASKPTVDGVTVSGADSVREGKPYTFSVAVNSAYISTGMVVKVNGEVVTLTNGSYTISSAAEDITISVEGVAKKEICNVTLPTGDKFTVTGAATVYKGENYTFTVTVKNAIYDATVKVNGSVVEGTNGSYTVENVSEDLVITVEVQRGAIPGTEVSVTDGVIDIADRNLYSLSSYYAKATNIQIEGVTIAGAYENGTNVYILLPYTVEDDAAVSVTFGTATNKCTVSGHTGSIKLENGEGTLEMTVKGSYSSWNGSVKYTLTFLREEAPTQPPVCVKTSDTAEVWMGYPLEIDLSEYFTGAGSYYLVVGETKTLIVGSKYTAVFDRGGEQTLTFTAENEFGECAERLTVTVTVKSVESGTWLGITTSNGSVNKVVFTDESGNLIGGLTAKLEGTSIKVSVPRNFTANGKIKATFDLTQNNGYPFLTTKTGTSGTSSDKAVNNKFTDKTTTLSSGEAAFTFYLYNSAPKTTDNKYTTYTIQYITANEAPVLAENQAATGEATITADQSYTLDLDGIFVDPDEGDSITGWKVSLNGAAATNAEVDENNVYSFSTDTAGEYTLAFYALDNYNVLSAATYTVTLTVENVKDTFSMTVAVPESLSPQFYVSPGFDSDGVDLQGDSIAAVAGTATNGMTVYTLNYPKNVTMLSVRDENWGGIAFEAVRDGSVTLRNMELSTVDYNNTVAESSKNVKYDGHTAAAGNSGWLLVCGTEYTITATPVDTATLAAVTEKITLAVGADVYSCEIMLGINNPLTITVTTGAKAQLYKYNKYYSSTELDAKIVKNNGDGTTTYSFIANTKDSHASFMYHISMEGKITKAGWIAWGVQNLTVLHSDNDKANTWRLDNYAAAGQNNSGVTEDSVLLNINSRNHLNLTVGQAKTLKAYRAWEIIKTSSDNHILTPDFTYTILSGSDVVSLTKKSSPSTADGDWMTLTALKEGTAIIEVTYDAMEVSGGSYDGTYGASDPNRSGFVVVTVGGCDESVNFGIDCFSSIGIKGSNNTAYNPNNKKAWDAEFDTLYFTEDSGTLNFKPSAGSTITEVAVSNDKGANWTTLTAVDGVYTATIVPGNNILRINTTSGVAYQIVRGDKITVKLVEVPSNSDEDGIIEAGETVRITLVGLHAPIPKMAGNYNPGYRGNYDGYSSQHINYTANGTSVYGSGAQYNFITAANYVQVVMPQDGSDVTLTDGYIGLGVIGLTNFADGGDSHRNIPDEGCATRDNQSTWHTRSILPEITIEAGAEAAANTPPCVRGDAPTTATLELSESIYTYAINLATAVFTDPDQADTLTYTVKVNEGEAAPVSAGYYTLVRPEVGTFTLLFTVSDGKASAEHTIELTVTEAKTSDPELGDGEDKEDEHVVYVSFVDFATRVAGESNVEYPNQLGTIVPRTAVPYTPGDTIADVTLRLLDSKGMTYAYSGSPKSGFYLSKIGNFSAGGIPVDEFGEFDAGNGSGWMITQNGVFIGQGASEFVVTDGDVIEWQYTCQLGKDIGDPYWDDEDAKDKDDDKTDIEADVQVSVSGNTATVDKVVLPEADSSTGAAAGNIVLDFSEVESSQPITTVAIPNDIVKQIANASGEAQKLEIVLTGGAAIELDAAALSEKASKSGGSDVKVSIENTASKLAGAQKEAVGSRPAYDIKITSGGKNISDMGKPITVYVPYTLKSGEKARGLVVCYVDDNGNKERCVTGYDAANKRVKWNTDHLSVYMIDYDEKLANNPFDDVADSAYYYDAVLWAYDSGITSGTSDTTFSPDASCTRAQMVTFLWRAAGKPAAKAKTHSFTDVDENAYYYEALLWAVENGITSGTSATTFSPDAACTRGQMAAFLYRSAKSPAVSGTHAFTDVAADAYYNKAVIWAAAEGITSGTSATTFSPDANCTRGQMAAFLYRYLAK